MKSEYALKRSTLPSDPGADPNEALSKTINQGEIFMKQLSSGFGDTLSGMNTKIGTSITQFDGLNNALGVRIQSELSVATQLDKFGRMAGYTGVATDATNVSPRYRDQLPKIDGAKALGDEAIPAGWQGLVGEKGPEILKVGAQSSIKSNTVSMGLLDQAVTKLPIMMSGMQNDLKMAMNEAKNSMPSVNDFQSLLTNFKTSISSTSQQPTGPQSSISTSTDFESALSKGIDMLNTSVKQLITAVEDGTYKNVKAVKNSGNMLA
jgi:spore germination protein YaaH